VQFFEHIAKYERLYRALLGSKGSPWFARKMRERLSDLIIARGHLLHGQEASAHPIPRVAEGLIATLVSAMFVEAITWWLEQGKPYMPKEIATYTSLLAAALFKEASTWR
jgi:hypothetical protein